jgi:hypothetical protein
MFSGGRGLLVFAAQRRTVSLPLRRGRKTAVVLAIAAERIRGAMQKSRYQGGWVVLGKWGRIADRQFYMIDCSGA